jgi:hypothetical protein
MKSASTLISLIGAALLSSCARYEGHDAREALAKAFGQSRIVGVEAVHGYYHSRREWLVSYNEGWMLQIRGPRASELVRQRWPDLQTSTGPTLHFMPDNPQADWWSASAGGKRWESAGDARYTIIEHERTGDWFILYMDG